MDVEITCKKCGIVGGLDDFYAHPFGKHGRDSKCKSCAKKYQSERREDPVKGPHTRRLEGRRRSTDEYNAKRRARMSIKRKTDLMYKLGARLRAMLRRSVLSTGTKKDVQSYELLGYTPDKLKQRLECQFEPGMSWETHGKHGWHIDHKKPIDAFVKEGVTNIRTINMLCNLSPMWGVENMSKGAKWTAPMPANDNMPAPAQAEHAEQHDLFDRVA